MVKIFENFKTFRENLQTNETFEQNLQKFEESFREKLNKYFEIY